MAFYSDGWYESVDFGDMEAFVDVGVKGALVVSCKIRPSVFSDPSW